MSIPQHLIDHFDVQAWLDEIGIPWGQGKNTSQGWISIPCPFCPDPDPSYHLGISPQKRVTCWRCGHRGSVVDLVFHLDPGKDVAQTLKNFRLFSINELKKDILIRSGENCQLPKHATKVFPQAHLNYLLGRRFDPDFLIKKYDLYATGPIFSKEEKEWRYRIVIPIYFRSQIVNFTGLDITKTQKQKYKHNKNELSLVPMKEILYNLDSVVDKMLVVEGTSDVWRMGPGTVATMGIEFTHAQINLIREARPKKVVIMYDSEPFAIEAAKDFRSALQRLKINSFVLPLSKGDPADLSEEEVREIRRIVFHE